MVREVKQLLKEHEKLTLSELSAHFSMEPEALEPILQVLVDKGSVNLTEDDCGTHCPGCALSCRGDKMLYEIVD